MSILAPTRLDELERLVSNPLDPEYEAWRAARKRYIVDKGVVVPVKTVGGASFLTGSQMELIYANVNAGTAKTTFTTEAIINDTTGMGPQAVLPPYFWGPGPDLMLGRGLRITARGIRTDVVTTPTWALFCRLGGSNSTAGPNIGSHAATQISATAATNLLWEYESDVIMTATGSGVPATGSSTVRGLGFATYQATTTTTLALQVFGGGATPGTVATVDPTILNYVNFSAACGTSSASNSITILQLLVFGLN